MSMTSMSSQCSQSFIKAETIRNCCLIFFASMCHSLPTHPNLCKQLCACFQYVVFFPVRFKQAAMHCQCVYIINMSVRTILHLWGSVEEHLQSLVVGSRRVDWSCSGQIYQICQLAWATCSMQLGRFIHEVHKSIAQICMSVKVARQI